MSIDLPSLWFWLVALLIGGWAVLDGFDLGAGILHRVVARTNEERRQVLASIGPVWDGNEVWLLAAGGSLFLAFPKAMAIGFSGLYLPLLFFVWSMMLRGISIELRSHLPSPLWRAFFDFVFQASSLAAALLSGVALGNVVRGVPLGPDGYFELPLFGSFSPTGRLGVLDWFTVSVGALSVVTLAAHGAMWVVYKTDGPVQARAKALAPRLWILALALWLGVTTSVFVLQPTRFLAWRSQPLAWLATLILLFGVVQLGRAFKGKTSESSGFLASALLIVAMLVLAVATQYPVLLPASPETERSLTIYDAAAGGASMGFAVLWWIPGIVLALLYFTWILRNFVGKAQAALDGEGY